MLEPGTQIGRYVVSRKLAEGGMAEIYLASALGPEGFSKEVVIKVVRSFLATDPQFVQMFIAEARLASRLNHANVVQIFDFGKHEDTYYLAMEYVRGASLWDLRQRCRQQGTPFPPTLAAELGVQISRGLQYAHSLSDKGQKLGVVHRDVTPHNVLLSFDGAVKLTDFGIAKAQTTHTAPGMLKGKFAYMSPEQARGEAVDARTDIFALGIVLWELLTGGKLFDGDSELAVLRAVEASVIAPPARLNPDVPSELSDIVMKALARVLPERFQSAFEFEKALATWVLRSAHTVEDTSVALFLQQVYGGEVQDDGRPEAPAGGAAAPVGAGRGDGDASFAHGDTMAVDRSKEHGARGAPQKTMTMTPVRASLRNATPRPRGVMDDDDAPARSTEEFRAPVSTEQMPAARGGPLPRATEQLPAYVPAAPLPTPAAGEAIPRPKTEQYRPASRRLEPLVIVDQSLDPSRVEPRPAPTDARPSTGSVTEPAGPDDLPLAPARSKAPMIAVGVVALLIVVAGGGYLATNVPAAEEPLPEPQPASSDEVRPALIEPATTPPVEPPPKVALVEPPPPVAPEKRPEAVTPPPPEKKPEALTPPARPEERPQDLPDQNPAPRAHPGGKRGDDSRSAAPKPTGTLVLRAVPYAEVSIAGRKAIEVNGTKSVKVESGAFDVVFKHSKKTEKKKVVLKPGETVKLEFDANAG